jgi:hypothetical protein
MRFYMSYFYEHWVSNKHAFRAKECEEMVNTYTQLGAVGGSIAWYQAEAGSGQVAIMCPVPDYHYLEKSAHFARSAPALICAALALSYLFTGFRTFSPNFNDITVTFGRTTSAS